MIMALDDARLQPFIEDIAALTIVGQAVMKCKLRGVSVTANNIVFFIGDFFDPNDPEFGDLISKINNAIDDVLASGSHNFEPAAIGE
jgi:hypothetical protein